MKVNLNGFIQNNHRHFLCVLYFKDFLKSFSRFACELVYFQECGKTGLKCFKRIGNANESLNYTVN